MVVLLPSCKNKDCCKEGKECRHHHTDKASVDRGPVYKEIMAIHDEAMPWMSDIQRISTKLQKVEAMDIESNTKIKNALTKLENADEAMMSWMDQMDHKNNNADYLKDQLNKVKAMRTEMKTAIQEGNDLLKSMTNE